MKPVTREEILDFETYRECREATREDVMAIKALRRVHVGGVLTFLFENRETIAYQIEEMLLAERIVREADIARELETYNELLGGPGELGATLLIEIETAAERDERLTRWSDLLPTLYARLADGRRVRPTFDARQISDGRLSSVHYLKFAVGGETPIALGCEHADIAAETLLSDAQRAALADDLRD